MSIFDLKFIDIERYMNISRDEFVRTLIEGTEQLEDTDVSEFFADLNWEKEAIFWNIYEFAFSKKLNEIKSDQLKKLNWLLTCFLSDDPVSDWIRRQMSERIKWSDLMIENLSFFSQNYWPENLKMDFEENYIDREQFRSIQNAKASLFEIFTMENRKKKLARVQILSLLKNKTNRQTLEIVSKLLNRIDILEYDIKKGTVIMSVTNVVDRAILRNIYKHTYPIKLTNSTNEITLENTNMLKKDEYLPFFHDIFEKIIKQAQIDTSWIPYKLSDISFEKKEITIDIPDKLSYERLDRELKKNSIAKKDISVFFFAEDIPDFTMTYNILPNETPKEYDKKKTIVEKRIVKPVNSKISIPVDKTKTFDDFITLSPEKIKEVLELLKNGSNIAIYGAQWTWKTHLTQAIANNIGMGCNIVYTTWNKFFQEYMDFNKKIREKKTNQNNNFSEFLDSFNGIDILIIDWIEVLWWSRVKTQSTLKKISNRYPDMKFILTSSQQFKDIAWNKEKITKDRTSYTEKSNLFREIKDLKLVMLQNFPKDKVRDLVESQRKNFSTKNSDLPIQLPLWVVNFLSKKVSPSLYPQIFESIQFNIQNDFSCINIFKIIMMFVSEKIRPEPEEIIDMIINLTLKDGKINGINREGMWIDIHGFEKREIRTRLNISGNIKPDSLEWIVLRLCVYTIKMKFPEKSYDDIWMLFNDRKDCSRLYSEADERLKVNKWLRNNIYTEIHNFLSTNYGLNEQQISIF